MFREWVDSRALDLCSSRTTGARTSFTILAELQKTVVPASALLRWGSPIYARKAENYFGRSDRVRRSARLGGRRGWRFEGGAGGDCCFDQAAAARIPCPRLDHAGAYS